jgi:protein-tyrosine kinase
MQNKIINPASSTISINTARTGKIGRLLIQQGKISTEDVDKIITAQEKYGLQFGDAAVKLGLISEMDVRQVLALQFNYPYLQNGQGQYSAELVAAYQPFSPQVEALRALRSQLMLRWFNESNKTLAIVTANSGEGGSYLAAKVNALYW